jgi:hypothetical protein
LSLVDRVNERSDRCNWRPHSERLPDSSGTFFHFGCSLPSGGRLQDIVTVRARTSACGTLLESLNERPVIPDFLESALVKITARWRSAVQPDYQGQLPHLL